MVLEALNALASAYVANVEAAHASGIAGALMWVNRPELIERMHRRWYYALLGLASAREQPGALLNARYYQRNARIFARLAAIATPGDRIVVVFGAGHSYWLRHFVKETPGYELVEPNTYLAAAAASGE